MGKLVFSRPLWGWFSFLFPASNQNPLHFIELHLVAPAIVELRGPRAGVVGDGRSLLERAAVVEIRRNAGRTEAVIADAGLDAGCLVAAADHGVRIGLGPGSAGELPRAAADGTHPYG
jgi:hypothetical protein